MKIYARARVCACLYACVLVHETKEMMERKEEKSRFNGNVDVYE